MEQSILNSIKKVIGLLPDDDSFDIDILMHVNSVFSTLTQLGVGPVEGFEIEDDTITWDAFTGTDPRLNFVKTYMYLTIKLIFDPPQNSFVTDSLNKRIEELGWRINVQREGEFWTDPAIPVTT